MQKLTLLSCLIFIACATPRTVHNDVGMKVTIDTRGIYNTEYTSLRNALIQNKYFIVVDRGEGFQSVIREQDLEHKIMANRFKDEEKHARYGELEGAGSIIKMERHCSYQIFPFILISFWQTCVVNLTLLDSSSGRVIAQVSDTLRWQSPTKGVDTFDGLVEDLIDAYPKKYEDDTLDPIMIAAREKAKKSAELAKKNLIENTYNTPTGEK
jgi:hypothetical protein